MKIKNARILLIPLALLAIIILAACTPATPDASVPVTPNVVNMNNGQSQSGGDMMNGQSEEEMMGNDQSGTGMISDQTEERMGDEMDDQGHDAQERR
jgi:hypothetical protein